MAVFMNGGENKRKFLHEARFDCVNYGRAVIYYQTHSFVNFFQPFSDSLTGGFAFCFRWNFIIAIVDAIYHSTRLCNFLGQRNGKATKTGERWKRSKKSSTLLWLWLDAVCVLVFPVNPLSLLKTHISVVFFIFFGRLELRFEHRLSSNRNWCDCFGNNWRRRRKLKLIMKGSIE